MKGRFITATGTDIGKTLVTCALLHQLSEGGQKVTACKPVQSGFDPANPADSDAGRILEASRLEPTPKNLDGIAPFRFAAPLSPDMAAAQEGRRVTLEAVVAHVQNQTEPVLVEGVGGVMVPLNETHTILDLIAALALPAILVTGSYLGTLSHTLTAAQILVQHDCPLAGVVISESEASSVALEDTKVSLSHHLPANLPMVVVPRIEGDRPWEQVPDLTALARF